MKVRSRAQLLRSERDRLHSFHHKEAIVVRLKGLGDIGYVANSIGTVIGDSMSAGRIYDKIGETAEGKVLYVMEQGVLCKLKKDSLKR